MCCKFTAFFYQPTPWIILSIKHTVKFIVRSKAYLFGVLNICRTKKYGVWIFHVSMHVQCHPRLSWLKCFSLTLFNSPLTSANKTHHDKLRREQDAKKFRNCVGRMWTHFFSTKLAMAAATLALNLEMRNMNLYVPDLTTSLLKRYSCFLTYFQFKWYYLKGFYRGNVI